MQKHHPNLLTLRGLMAVMVVIALTVGGSVLAKMHPDRSGKIAWRGGHVILGRSIGVTLFLRLLTRSRSTEQSRPEMI